MCRARFARPITENMKIDINLTGQYRQTDLHITAQEGFLDLVKYLINSHHCDLLVNDLDNDTAFELAVKNKRLEVIMYLVVDAIFLQAQE